MSIFQSIWSDVQRQLQYGNMVTQLIIVNVAVFIGVHLLDLILAIGGSGLDLAWLAMPMGARELLFKPWTPITYMFLHWDFWHILWNMVFLYWFGRILQDLLGNARILPVYFYGGLAGGALAFLLLNVLPDQQATILLGASAGVSAVLMAAATLAPDYVIVLFVWPVRIKYIALARIILDLIAVKAFVNTGGSVAHLGGVAMGYAFIRLLQNGTDLSVGFNAALDGIQGFFGGLRRKNMRVVHRNPNPTPSSGPAAGGPVRTSPVGSGSKTVRRARRKRSNVATGAEASDVQTRVDAILDKIGVSGYDSLSKEEQEFLRRFSNDG